MRSGKMYASMRIRNGYVRMAMDKRLLEQALLGASGAEWGQKMMEFNFSGVNMRLPQDTHLVVTTVEVNPKVLPEKVSP